MLTVLSRSAVLLLVIVLMGCAASNSRPPKQDPLLAKPPGPGDNAIARNQGNTPAEIAAARRQEADTEDLEYQQGQGRTPCTPTPVPATTGLAAPTAGASPVANTSIFTPAETPTARRSVPGPSVAQPNWLPLSAAGAPSPRTGHAAIWTGTEMIVWGGHGPDRWFCGGSTSAQPGRPQWRSDGARYDLASDTWRPMAAGPAGNWANTAIWTGREMLIWNTESRSLSAAAYDPAADRWRSLPSFNRTGAVPLDAVWTGREALFWSGHGTGAIYDPATDQWRPMSTTDAPRRRSLHTTVWTGRELFVWGGLAVEPGEQRGSYIARRELNDGGLYDPTTDRWRPVSQQGAPLPRSRPVAAWSGRDLLVWGGEWLPPDRRNSDDRPMGFSPQETRTDWARYDPSTDTWTPQNGPAPGISSASHTAQTSLTLISWGGEDTRGESRDAVGSCYNLATGKSQPLTPWPAGQSPFWWPPGRRNHSLVWTGSEVIIWGGGQQLGQKYLNDGARIRILDGCQVEFRTGP